jgi:hypothetical protein
MRMRARYDQEEGAIARLRAAADLASSHGSVALVRRCEADLSGRGDLSGGGIRPRNAPAQGG